MLAAPAVLKGPNGLGEVQTISLVHQLTGERYRGVYSEDGEHIPEVMHILDWMLRDVNVDEVRPMNAGLIDVLSGVQHAYDLSELIVTSGYRTRRTNERLRIETGKAARNSYHISGKAADVYSLRVGPRRLANAARAYGAGGVGYYPRNGFMHVDVGPRRSWRG